MAHLEGAYDQVAQRLAGFDLRFDALDRKIESLRGDLGARIDALAGKTLGEINRLDSKVDALAGKVDRHFMWTVGLIFGTWATTIVTLVALIHR